MNDDNWTIRDITSHTIRTNDLSELDRLKVAKEPAITTPELVTCGKCYEEYVANCKEKGIFPNPPRTS